MVPTHRAWWLFAAVAALVFAVFGWIANMSISLERSEHQVRVAAERENRVRLALWQMDSALADAVAREAARPVDDYMPRIPATAPATQGAVAFADSPAWVRRCFQIEPNGRVSSPLGGAAAVNLQQVGELITWESARNTLARVSPVRAAARPSEFSQRANVANLAQNQFGANVLNSLPNAGDVELTALVPVWCRSTAGADELFWIRRVRVGAAQRIQGFWADWPALERWLLASAGDLAVGSRLLPAGPPGDEPSGRRLAGVPAILEPAWSPADLGMPFWTPSRVTLAVGGFAVIGAMAAVALVLRAALALAERRGQFVSAVTHELRTPLTTFRMYSEMLAEGMVPDEQTRREYLGTLTREAQRLADVVERILLYARVERSRAVATREKLAVADLLEKVRTRLEQRAAESRMQLCVDPGEAAQVVVSVDVQACEQILFNLVDNSCKYANAASDRRLEIGAKAGGRFVQVHCRDHGPGISATDARRIFSPFRRGARELDHSTPGIGLGLTLARGLARELGGDLKVERRTPEGAAFVLTLPCA